MADYVDSPMRMHLGLLAALWLGLAGCGTAETPATSPTPPRVQPRVPPLVIDEIEDPVATPSAALMHETGQPCRTADPRELQAAGHYFFRSGALDRATDFYEACIGGAEGPLRAACQWALGTVLVDRAWAAVDEGGARRAALGLAPVPASREVCLAMHEFERATTVLGLAQRLDPTTRRADILAQLDERLAVCGDCQASDCRPSNCPELPYGWHRRHAELEVLGSGLEGLSRERVHACFGAPASFTDDTWLYWRGICGRTRIVRTTIRLRFDAGRVDRITHERRTELGSCGRTWD